MKTIIDPILDSAMGIPCLGLIVTFAMGAMWFI